MGTLQHKAANVFWTFIILILVEGTLGRNVFYPQTEYKYEYTGQVTAGIPSVNNEVNGVGIKCDVIIQADTNDITVQLSNIHSFSGVTVDSNTSVEVPMDYRPQSFKELEYPFKMSYNGDQARIRDGTHKPLCNHSPTICNFTKSGLRANALNVDTRKIPSLNDIEMANNDIPESVNIKRALAVFLTIRLDQYAQNRQSYDPNQKDKGPKQVFQVEEDGYEGRCISRYTYENLRWPGKPYSQVLNVTKKHENCREQTTYKISINEPKKCVGCRSESLSFINHGHQTQYNLLEEGGRFVLETAVAFGRAAYTPFPPKGESIKTKQYQKLRLLGIGQSSRRISLTSAGTQRRNLGIVAAEIDLKARYRRDVENLKTKKQMTEVFSSVKQKIYKQTKPQTPLQRAQTILDSTLADCRDLYNCTIGVGLYKVTNVVDQLRRCDFNELRQFYTTNINDESKRKMVIDALAMTGTTHSILVIKKLIEERKLTGETAVQVISSLPAYALDPQPAILEELWALCKDQLMSQSRQLFVTTMLAFGEMTNQACAPKQSPKTIVPYVVRLKGCPSSLVNKYLQELMAMYESSTEPWQKTTVMFAISKMGMNQSLDYLGPYFQSKIFTLPIGHRIEIMLALFDIGPSRQKEVVEYILPIFHNKTLSSEERIIAFDVLAYITTSQDLMNELALSTWEEPSSQVASYVYNYFKNVATLKTPCWKPMALRSEKALLLAKPVQVGYLDSGFHVHLAESEKWGLHSTFAHGMVRSSNSLAPRVTLANLMQEVGGYYYSLFELYTLNDGLQKVLDNLIGPKADFTGQVRFSDIFKEDSQTANEYNRNTDDTLVTPRNEEQLYSRVALTYLQDRHRLFFLDKYILDDIKESQIFPPNKDVMSSLRDGIPIDYKKHLLILDNQIKFSSMIGTPMTITAKMPALINIEGAISAEATKMGIKEALSNFIIKPQITTTIGLSMWAGIHMEDIFDKTVKSAGVASKMFLEVPLHGEVHADLLQQTLSLNLQSQQQANPSYPTDQNKPRSPFNWKVMPLLSSYDQETGHHDVHPLQTNSDLYKQKSNEYMGTWSLTQDTNERERTDRKLKQKPQNYLEYSTLSWVPRHFSYEEVTYGDSMLLNNELEVKINWKHTPSPYEAELWKDKSPLQQLRPWNFIPEWKEGPVTCSPIDPRGRLESNEGQAPKKGWFGRIKDKVKSWGRSGGSEDGDQEGYQRDSDNTNEDTNEEEDRGRGLHPHHIEGETDSGSDYDGQTHSSSHGSIRSNYEGQSSVGISGQFTGQVSYSGQTSHSGQTTSQYGDLSGGAFSQSRGEYGVGTGSQHGISQTYGGTGEEQWVQRTGKNDNQDIFTQKSFDGKGGVGGQGQWQGPGHLQGQGQGQSGGSPKSRVINQKKSTINRLKSANEASQTVVIVQMKAKKSSEEMKANMEITFSNNVAQASKRINANLDFSLSEKTRKINTKVCLNGQFLHGYKECQHQDTTTPSFDMKLSWGESKCNEAKNFLSLKGTYSVRDEDKNHWNNYKYLCGDDKKSPKCLEAFNKATTLTKAVYELRYTESKVNDYMDQIIMHIMREHPDFIVKEYDLRQKTDDGYGIFEAQYNLETKLLELSARIPRGYVAFERIPYEDYSGLLGPRNRATSVIHQLGNDLANGEIATTCVVNLDTVSTFSGINYNYTLQSCPLIVAKDCSSTNLFTITASDSKVTVDIYGHRIESSPEFGQPNQNYPEVLVDGKVEQIKESEISIVRSQGEEDIFVASLSANGESVTIKSPPMGLIVTFTKTSLTIVVSQFWKGKVCGICGEDVSDTQKTFLGPTRCLYAEPEAFARSYLLKGCLASPDVYGSQKPCIQQPPIYQSLSPSGYPTSSHYLPPNTGNRGYGESGGIDSYKPPPYDTSYPTQTQGIGFTEGDCYVRRNQLKRQSSRQITSLLRKVNKVCFSSEALRQCRQSCVGYDHLSVNVKFQCYDETSSLGSQLLAVVEERPLTELPIKEPDFEEQIMIPQKCTPKN